MSAFIVKNIKKLIEILRFIIKGFNIDVWITQTMDSHIIHKKR